MMKSYAAALGLAVALMSIGTASASYRLSPYVSQEERDRYEADHTMLNRYHPEDARAAMARSDAKNHNARSATGASDTAFTEGERNWFKQSSGEQYGGCAIEVSRPC